MSLQEYIADIQKRYATGIAREHAYRPALQALIEELLPDVTATNDPARIDCGSPDFILSRKKIDVGYIEAKDIGVSLDKVEKDKQLKRYLAEFTWRFNSRKERNLLELVLGNCEQAHMSYKDLVFSS